jgi:hypothetical protein
MGQRLAKYKSLSGGVKRVLVIERNASGKILKNLLRDDTKEETGAKHGIEAKDQVKTNYGLKSKRAIGAKDNSESNKENEGDTETKKEKSSNNAKGTELDDDALAALLKFISPAACFR